MSSPYRLKPGVASYTQGYHVSCFYLCGFFFSRTRRRSARHFIKIKGKTIIYVVGRVGIRSSLMGRSKTTTYLVRFSPFRSRRG
jgi:hypothetical protein